MNTETKKTLETIAYQGRSILSLESQGIPVSPAPYRDTKLPSCSQAHLGFYDTHIYGIFMSTYRTFRGTFYAGSLQSSLANASTFWQSVRSFPRDVMLSKRVVKRVSLGLNFNQLPLKAVDKWSAAQVL